ncbi:MAG: hypothetical protein ACREM1_18775 [Longimicrobiales bacterium]
MLTRFHDTSLPTAGTSRNRVAAATQLTLFDFAPNSVPISIDLPEREPVTAHVSAGNYRITPNDRIGIAGPRQKAEDNLRAIRLLHELQGENRRAARDEQAVLVRYAGWGSLAQAFIDDHADWGWVGTELRRLLEPADYAKAEASTPNAHYTSEPVIRGIYRILDHLGFSGGSVLEPALGVGHFIGLMPDELARKTRWTGIELDPTTVRIARALYPECDIRNQAFEEALLDDGPYDLVVSNVPFGRYPVYDPVHNPLGFRIHDYFFARALAAVRPGGVVAMLTSRYTLDKRSSRVREHLAGRADFIGAVRLPNNAFLANAGTEVTADLLIVQRRTESATDNGERWRDTVQVETPDGPAWINEYFARHPEMMLGRLRLNGGMYRSGEVTLEPRPDEDLEEALARAAERLPTSIFPAHCGARTTTQPATDVAYIDSVRDGAFIVVNGTLKVREGTTLVNAGLRSARDVDRVKELVAIRDAVRRVLESQNRELSEAARADLNARYDAFVYRWGPINREAHSESRDGGLIVRRPNLTPFRRDPEAMNVAALEIYDPETDTAAKAAIFTQRVVRPRTEPRRAETAEDALLIVLDREGRLDLAAIGELWGGRSAIEVADALRDRIYRDPETGGWATVDAYLSGPVREKLRTARCGRA